MRYLVCYDIAHDRRRDRLVTVLLNYAKRVQESVFVADFSGHSEEELVGRMKEEIGRVVAEAEDKVHIFALCGACQGKVVVMGEAELPVERPYYIV